MSSTDSNPSSIIRRPRRLRLNASLRRMVQQVRLTRDDLICPLFVCPGAGVRRPIASMPGQFQFSVDELVQEARSVFELGIPAVILFGIPSQKDATGSDAFNENGIIQQATRAIKKELPELLVVTDVCLCEYTDHGHCGLVNQPSQGHPTLPEGYVLNDATLNLLGKIAVSQVAAGADIVAPSGMIDGMVSAIRDALDHAGYEHIPVMSYSIKFASEFYGPFRDAADGAPGFGDRKSHQMDPANEQQAILEARLDVEQGADFLMVKPALAYLDVISSVRRLYPEMPLVAYNVSGEYAMIKAAAEKGWLDESGVVPELLTGIKRAGADLIITYHAKDVCQWLNL